MYEFRPDGKYNFRTCQRFFSYNVSVRRLHDGIHEEARRRQRQTQGLSTEVSFGGLEPSRKKKTEEKAMACFIVRGRGEMIPFLFSSSLFTARLDEINSFRIEIRFLCPIAPVSRRKEGRRVHPAFLSEEKDILHRDDAGHRRAGIG